LRAVDKASDVIQGVANKTERSISQVEKANKKVEKSSKDVALAFNNVATSGFALYNAVDRVMDMQVQVDRANLAVKTSLNSVEDAQKRYNAAVEKFGVDSEQAQTASKDLQLAQERYQVACERADMIQGNLNEAMVQSALTVIPSLITMITSISTLTQGWTAVTHGASAALNFLAANPIVLVVAGIAALVAGLVWAYQNCEPFRNAVNAIAGVLGGALSVAINAVYGALKWLWDSVLVPLASFLIGNLLKAWNALCNGFNWAYQNLLKPIFDAISWVYNNILKPVADFFSGVGSALSGIGSAISNLVTGGGGGPVVPIGGGVIPHHAKGGIFTKPTLGIIGEAGPEALIPLNEGSLGLGIVNISINIAGSADRATAEYVARLVEEKLKNIILDPSSSQAPTTHKKIRFGA
jgi:phage-related protein